MGWLYLFSVLDAWGKLPSGILEGNLQSFGSFSECFHIDRNGTLYKSKYCLGQLAIDFNGMPGLKPFNFNMINAIPNIFQSNNETEMTPRRTIAL